MAKPRNPSFDGAGAKAATAGAKALSGSLTELAAKGQLSAASMNQLGVALGQLNPALGLVAAAGVAVYTSFRILKDLEVKDALTQFGASARVTSAEFERFASVVNAGAGESGELRERLEELANAQFNLDQKTQQVAERRAELTEKTKGMTAAEIESAEASFASYAATVMQQLPAAAEKVAAIQAIVDALKKERAEATAASEANKRWTKSHEDAIRLAAALRQARVDSGVLNDGGIVDQLEQEEAAREQLRLEMQHSMETTGHVTQLQVDEMAMHERNISVLEIQKQTYEALGNMAMQAIGQVGAAAFDQYADAMDRVIDGHNAFNKSSGRALQNATSQIIKQVGREAAVYAIMETAKGIAASTGPAGLAAFGDPSGHFAAAATFAAVAAAAGVGAGALSVKSGSGGAGRGSGGSGGGGGSGKTLNLSLTVIGTLDSSQRRNLFAQLAQEFAEAG